MARERRLEEGLPGTRPSLPRQGERPAGAGVPFVAPHPSLHAVDGPCRIRTYDQGIMSPLL